MGRLDDFFLGRNRERRALANARLNDLQNAKILTLTERGALIETPDRRASTSGAATALMRTTGSLPEGFFATASRQSLVPFSGETGASTLAGLNSRGVRAGSNVSELGSAVNGDTGREAVEQSGGRLADLLNDFVAGNSGRPASPASSSGGRFGGGNHSNPSGISSPGSGVRQGFGLLGDNPDNSDLLLLNDFLNVNGPRSYRG